LFDQADEYGQNIAPQWKDSMQDQEGTVGLQQSN